MGTPERKQEITKQDLPYQVMGKYLWATSNQEALTKFARKSKIGIITVEYFTF